MKVKLRDFVELVKTRVDIKDADVANYISTDNMLPNRGGVEFGNSKLPTTKTVNNFIKGDVLISNIRPYFKKIWLADRSGTRSSDVLCFRATNEKLSKEYLYCVLQSDSFFNYVMSTSKGTKMPRGDKEAILDYEFELVSKEEQYDKYHSILLLERKIYLNNRINDNLLKLAQTIFQEILKISSLHALTISDVGTVVGGGTPSKRVVKYWNGDIPWLSPKDLSNHLKVFTSHGENNITQEGLDNSSTKLLPQNTILFSSRAPIGYLSIANNQIATNQGFKSVIPNKGYPFWFIYELLKSETPKIINEANGSTFKEISGGRLKQHAIGIPSSADVLEYNSVFLPLFDKIRQSENEIDSLNQIKTALLNRLF